MVCRCCMITKEVTPLLFMCPDANHREWHERRWGRDVHAMWSERGQRNTDRQCYWSQQDRWSCVFFKYLTVLKYVFCDHYFQFHLGDRKWELRMWSLNLSKGDSEWKILLSKHLKCIKMITRFMLGNRVWLRNISDFTSL